MKIFEAINFIHEVDEETVTALRQEDDTIFIQCNQGDDITDTVFLEGPDAQRLAVAIAGTDWKEIAELYFAGEVAKADRLFRLATANEIHYVDYDGNFLIHKPNSPYTRLAGNMIIEVNSAGEIVGEYAPYLSKEEIIDVIQGRTVHR